MSISEFISAHEAGIRLGAFFLVFASMALWEVLVPRRALAVSKGRRWASNLGIVVLNSVLARLLFPVAGVGMAAFAAERGWGLFNYLDTPDRLAVVASVIALDCAIYLQHVMFHAVPVLWRLHRMHHADPDFDVTTGARFHPIEIALSMLIKFAAIVVLGAPVVAVVVFEVLLNATAMFNHSNVRIPVSIDRLLRWFVVTPDMHRIHHSVERDETDSNFGFSLALWDRLLGTYRADPRAAHADMVIGIPEFRAPVQCTTLAGMLAIPFQSGTRNLPVDVRPRHENR